MPNRINTVAEVIAAPTTGTLTEGSRSTHTETLYSVVDVSVDSTTVYNGPALLFGVYVNTVLSAHTLPITDSATTVITLPASWAAASMQSFPGIRFETSLIVNPNDAATGNITVAYKPI